MFSLYFLQIIRKYLVHRLKRQKNYSMIDCIEKVVNHFIGKLKTINGSIISEK
jgi:hypothetical protein